MYQRLRSQGVMLLGVVTETDTGGQAADASYAATYASRYGWTFPSVAGEFDYNYWPPDAVASGEIGLPLNLFVDLREMRIYGRFSGGTTETTLMEATLSELADEPAWAPDGGRLVDMDCGDPSRTENEPNSFGETPEDGSTLPFSMTGTLCPPTIADNFFVDEDVIDLGTLAAGDAFEVSVTRDAGTAVFPFFQLIMESGGSISWVNYGPAMLDVDTASRMFVADTAGHYYAVIADGRLQAQMVYGEGATVPGDEQCCQGGPDHTYTAEVTAADPTAVTPATALSMGETRGTLTDGVVNVHPFDATAGTYNIRYIADDNAHLDPYLIVLDGVTGELLGSNDDESYPSNINSLVTVTLAADTTILVLTEYWGSWFLPTSPPDYTIRID